MCKNTRFYKGSHAKGPREFSGALRAPEWLKTYGFKGVWHGIVQKISRRASRAGLCKITRVYKCFRVIITLGPARGVARGVRSLGSLPGKLFEKLFLSKQFSGIRSAGRIRKIVCYQKQFFTINNFLVESDSEAELKK